MKPLNTQNNIIEKEKKTSYIIRHICMLYTVIHTTIMFTIYFHCTSVQCSTSSAVYFCLMNELYISDHIHCILS